MKNKKIQSLSAFLFLTLFLVSCGGQATIEPTATIVATSTATETPMPSPTFTQTLLPSETPIPQPASLTGVIFLSDNAVQPFISSVELRQKDSFTLIGKSDTDSSGVYKIENIDPGVYELWVLITTKIAMVSGCADVAPPDDKWKIGIKFDEDKALSMENAYLSKGLLLAENLQTSDLKAEGFFAVLDRFEIESGIENKIDVILLCK